MRFKIHLYKVLFKFFFFGFGYLNSWLGYSQASGGIIDSFVAKKKKSHNYDFKESAIILDSLENWSSFPQAFHNKGSSPDGNGPKCWKEGPKRNVWFKFKANTSQIEFIVKTGKRYGSLKYPVVVLYDSNSVLLSCNVAFEDGFQEVKISSKELIFGDWYYVSVDCFSGCEGNFSLQVNNIISPGYDEREGAIVLENLENWCSDPFEFSNAGMTSDGSDVSCWSLGERLINNVWFKFKATEKNISIRVITNKKQGTIKYPRVALFNELSKLLVCANSRTPSSDVILKYRFLKPGFWYYLTIDNAIAKSYSGSFTLCSSTHIGEGTFGSIFMDFSNLSPSSLEVKTSDGLVVPWLSGPGTGVLALEVPVPDFGKIDTVKIYPDGIPDDLKARDYHLGVSYTDSTFVEEVFIWRDSVYRKFSEDYYLIRTDTLLVFDEKPLLDYENYEEGLDGRVFNPSLGKFRINLPRPDLFEEILLEIINDDNAVISQVSYPTPLEWDGSGVPPGRFSYKVHLKAKNEAELTLEGQFVIE